MYEVVYSGEDLLFRRWSVWPVGPPGAMPIMKERGDAKIATRPRGVQNINPLDQPNPLIYGPKFNDFKRIIHFILFFNPTVSNSCMCQILVCGNP